MRHNHEALDRLIALCPGAVRRCPSRLLRFFQGTSSEATATGWDHDLLMQEIARQLADAAERVCPHSGESRFSRRWCGNG